MTAKFDDPKTKALLTSVSGSAAIFRAVFIAYLIFAGYAGAIILSVTDRDLFLDADLTAPVLNVKFKTSYFFIVVPCIFLLLHLTLLTHMSVLVKKLIAYRDNISSDGTMLVLPDGGLAMPQVKLGSDSAMLGLLPDVLLIQSVDNQPSDFRKYFLKGVFVYGVLIVLPIFILCFIWIEFLDFQSITITLFHFMVIIADVVLIRYFFPDMEEIDTSQENKNIDVRLGVIVGTSIITIVLVILSFITLDYYRIHKSFSGSAYSTYINGIMELDVSGQRLYLDLESDVSPTEACKEENKILGAVLKNRSYKGANLEGAILCHVNLMGSQLQGANLIGTELQGANLESAQLQGANLVGAELQGANLESAQLQGANLVGAELQGANLVRATLQGADLREAELQGADLREAELQSAGLVWAQLQGAYLAWAELQGADLSGAQLQGAYLGRAELQGAYLGGAQLQGAYLGGAQLQGAYLGRAELQGAYLGRAQLQGAYLASAQLQGAYSGGVELEDIHQPFARFNEGIKLRINQKSELKGISTVTITNMAEYIKIITTKMGEFVSNGRVIYFIKRMKESEANPSANISQAITVSYTKEDARQWIEKNKKAMCKIPKDIYEEKYRGKLDCQIRLPLLYPFILYL